MYSLNAYSTDNGIISINRDDIRREVNIVFNKDNSSLYIKLDVLCKDFNSIDMVIRTSIPTKYKVFNDEKEIASGELDYWWNRIKIEKDIKNISTLKIQFMEKGEYGFGEVYFIK